MIIICFSCQDDNDIQIDNDLSNEIENNIVSSSAHRESLDRSVLVDGRITLRNAMQWAAFLTAETIWNDSNARAFFISSLGNSNTLDLSILLDDTSIGSQGSLAFRNAFEQEFERFSSGEAIASCGGNRLIPRGGPSLPQSGGGNSNCTGVDPDDDPFDFCPSEFERFVGYLIHANCLELYLPNGFNNNSSQSIVSSANPLKANRLENTAYRLPFDCNNNSITIKNTNFNTFGNVITVRPFRPINIFLDDSCNYSEYSDIDFTEFLSN